MTADMIKATKEPTMTPTMAPVFEANLRRLNTGIRHTKENAHFRSLVVPTAPVLTKACVVVAVQTFEPDVVRYVAIVTVAVPVETVTDTENENTALVETLTSEVDAPDALRWTNQRPTKSKRS